MSGGGVSSIILVYGFPLSLLGFALKYAELKPVPCKTTEAAFDLRETQMTDIQKQVREDTTRYRYIVYILGRILPRECKDTETSNTWRRRWNGFSSSVDLEKCLGGFAQS